MFPKFNTIRIFSHSVPRKTNPLPINLPQRFFVNPYCNGVESAPSAGDGDGIVESPELPDWVKFSDSKANPASKDDDFVAPSFADYLQNYEPNSSGTRVSRVSRELSDERPSMSTADRDVDKISNILKNRRGSSPELVAQALGGWSVDLSETMVEKLLKRYSNDWVSAFGFFRWAQSQMGYSHSADSYNAVIDSLGKGRQFHLVWNLVDEMHGAGRLVSFLTFTNVFKRLARAGQSAGIVAAFQRMEQYGLRKDTSSMNLVMDNLVKADDVEKAQDVFREFRHEIPPDIRTFNILIHGWCKFRKFEFARKTMKAMQRRGFQPDVISYTSFVEAHCQDRDFRKAEAVLDTMQEKGCTPNVVTFTIMMHALGKAKEIKKAVGVYEKMKKNGCQPDSAFYSSLIYILSCAGRLKDARDVFEDMKNQGLTPDVLTYNTMISIACDHSQEETALKLLREMEVSCRPNLKTYGPLLKLFCKKKRMKVISFLLDHMLRNDVSIDLSVYSSLVHRLCQSGKLKHACMFMEECVFKGFVPTDVTYNHLLQELEKKNMGEAKKRIEGLMLRARKQTARVIQI